MVRASSPSEEVDVGEGAEVDVVAAEELECEELSVGGCADVELDFSLGGLLEDGELRGLWVGA